MSTDYKKMRRQFKVDQVDRLPSGKWVTVSVAARLLKVSKQTIRLRYLRGEIKAIKFSKSPLLVNLSESQKD